MEAIKLCRLDTPIIFIEARINLSRFVVTGCAAKTSARSEERFSRNAETDLVCRLLLEKKNRHHARCHRVHTTRPITPTAPARTKTQPHQSRPSRVCRSDRTS